MGNVLFFPMNDLVSFKNPSAMPEIAEFGTAELDCSIFPNVPIKQQSQCDPQDGRDDNRDNPAECSWAKGRGTFMPKKPETMVGTVSKIDHTVMNRMMSFKLLFKTVL